MTLRLINDTELDVEFCYKCDDAAQRLVRLPSGKEKTVCLLSRIIINKKDIWKDKTHLLYLFCLDPVFGNIMDPENLPFSIQFTYQQNESSCEVLKVSSIIDVSEESVIKWEKGGKIQTAFLTSVIIGLSIVLSFIFESILIRSLFLIICTFVALFLCGIVRKRIRNVKTCLIGYSKDNK